MSEPTAHTVASELLRDENRREQWTRFGLYRGNELASVTARRVDAILAAAGPELSVVDGEDHTARERFKLLSLDDLDNLPDREYLVDGWIVVGLNVDVGEPGSKKSFVALDQGLCIAAGVPWLGHEVKQGPVVYIAAEGAYGLKRRRDAWMAERNVSDVPDFHIIAEAPRLMEDAEVVLLE